MSSYQEVKIAVKLRDDKFAVLNINTETTVDELRIKLYNECNITLKSENMKILCIYPPKALPHNAKDLELKDIKICSGETVMVEEKNAAELVSRRSVEHGGAQSSTELSFELPGFHKSGAASKSNVARVFKKTAFELPGFSTSPAATKTNAALVSKKSFELPGFSRSATRTDDEIAAVTKSVSKLAVATKSESFSGIKGKVAEPQFLPAVEDSTSSSNIEGAHDDDDDSSGGIMLRHVVPSDNSSLFASVYFLISNGKTNPQKTVELRKLVANVVKENPNVFPIEHLGMSNEEYSKWIQNTGNWGGAIELQILSNHFKIEIVAVDTQSLDINYFGKYCHNYRVILIQDGINYEPLALEQDNGQMRTILPVTNDSLIEMALEIAIEVKSSKQLTDARNFSFKCSVCKMYFRRDREARRHSFATGHFNVKEIIGLMKNL